MDVFSWCDKRGFNCEELKKAVFAVDSWRCGNIDLHDPYRSLAVRLETPFEKLLWWTRFLLVIPVVLSVVLAVAMLYVAAVDSGYVVMDLLHYATFGADTFREQAHNLTVARLASVLDSFLFAAILIVFSFGLYELFISKIDAAERSEVAPRLLLIRNLDDLKERLGKVVFLILVVRYFQSALQSDVAQPLDLLYLALGIALLGVALYLTARRQGSDDRQHES